MLISKINAYAAITKSYINKKTEQTFKGNLPNPKKCFSMSDSEFKSKYGGYKGIVTYNEILSLKNLAEQSQKNGMTPNLAIAFFSDPVADVFVAASQADLINGNAKWTQINDIDSV